MAEIPLSELERTLRLDSEFFNKSFLNVDARLKLIKTDLLTKVVVTSDGNHFSISDEFLDAGIPYYRGQNVTGHFFIEQSQPVCIPHSAFSTPHMTRSHLFKGDVLLSIVGTIGELSLVSSETEATCSCKLAILRPELIKPGYLAVFLKTRYGQYQIQRLKRGAVQMGLLLEDMDQLRIARFAIDFEEAVEKTVGSAKQTLDRSIQLYKQAETLLLTTLNLADFSPSTEITNIKSFKVSFGVSGRLDAEYYQPKFDELEAKIAENHELVSLGSLVTLNQRGTQPDYAEEGLPVINSKHVREGEVILSDNRLANVPDKEEPLLIQKGDVLINGTGVGTIGRSAPYLHEQNALPDNHVTILRTDKLNPIFLSVYLNSIAGKYQVDKYFKGSSGQIELYPKDIDCFYVPLVDETIQTEIAALVQQSFTLKAESERLLDIAKRAVEIAIEQDEKAAMAFIEANT